MPTPSKPYAVIQYEKKSHRTKAELSQRKQEEAALSSQEKIKKRKEVRENKTASREFNRIEKLLKKIDKNDALYEPVINRYCLIQAECKEIEERRAAFFDLIILIEEKIRGLSNEDKERFSNELLEISKNIVNLSGHMNNCDRILQQKRKMLLDIEKENIMTVASALRSIPKKPKKESSPLLEALGG